MKVHNASICIEIDPLRRDPQGFEEINVIFLFHLRQYDEIKFRVQSINMIPK